MDISDVFKQILFGCYSVKYEEMTSHSICINICIQYICIHTYLYTVSNLVGIPHKWTLFQLGDLF